MHFKYIFYFYKDVFIIKSKNTNLVTVNRTTLLLQHLIGHEYNIFSTYEKAAHILRIYCNVFFPLYFIKKTSTKNEI